MTTVYIDELLLLNFLINYFLLLGTARLLGERALRLRLMLGALIGAAYALIVLLPGMGWAAAGLVKAGTAALMVLVAFGQKKRLPRAALLFFAVSCAFGGSVLAVQLLQGRPVSVTGGLLYAPAGLKTLLFSGAVCYGLFLLVFGRLARHGGLRRDLVTAVLTAEGRRAELTALSDTGNTLTDPVSNRPVLVAELEPVKRLLPAPLRPLFCRRALERPAETFEVLSQLGEGNRFRLIPYRAVGVESGLLLAFRTDSAVIGGKCTDGLLVALSPTPVSDGGAYTALTGF